MFLAHDQLITKRPNEQRERVGHVPGTQLEPLERVPSLAT